MSLRPLLLAGAAALVPPPAPAAGGDVALGPWPGDALAAVTAARA
jgi:hypothetical protein